MDMQPQPIHFVAMVAAAIFIVMVWKVPTWQRLPLQHRWAITIILPIISYVIGSFFADS